MPDSTSTIEHIKPFRESQTSVQIRKVETGKYNGKEGVFVCDEEPHFLKPDLGYGFNPLKLGERLQGRKPGRIYEIVRKLGFGGGSSVWLVKFNRSVLVAIYIAIIQFSFQSDSTNEKHFLAVKVLTVNLTAGILYDEYWELSSAERVTDANPNHPGYQHCLMLRDSFICNSYHGPHMSLAFDVLGSNIMSLQRRQPNRVFSLQVTKRIVKQVLLALDYLHHDCGLVHTGDHV